jgi:hypothetical protein
MYIKVVNTKVIVYKIKIPILVKKILKITLKSRNIAYIKKFIGESIYD